MSTADVVSFIEKLKDAEFRIQLIPALKNVREGDWAEVVCIAASKGFHFTSEELQQVAPAGFFRGAGARPDLGWARSTLAK